MIERSALLEALLNCFLACHITTQRRRAGSAPAGAASSSPFSSYTSSSSSFFSSSSSSRRSRDCRHYKWARRIASLLLEQEACKDLLRARLQSLLSTSLASSTGTRLSDLHVDALALLCAAVAAAEVEAQAEVDVDSKEEVVRPSLLDGLLRCSTESEAILSARFGAAYLGAVASLFPFVGLVGGRSSSVKPRGRTASAVSSDADDAHEDRIQQVLRRGGLGQVPAWLLQQLRWLADRSALMATRSVQASSSNEGEGEDVFARLQAVLSEGVWARLATEAGPLSLAQFIQLELSASHSRWVSS